MGPKLKTTLVTIAVALGGFAGGMLFERLGTAASGKTSENELRFVYQDGRTQGYYEARRRASLEDDPQALDALERWAVKNSRPSFSPKDFAMQKIFIPTQNQGDGQSCVSLTPNPPEPSGTPVYCYRNETLQLVAEYTDVE